MAAYLPDPHNYVSGLGQEAVQMIVNLNILLEQCDLENLGMYLWLQHYTVQQYNDLAIV